jgi:hypothetical protein
MSSILADSDASSGIAIQSILATPNCEVFLQPSHRAAYFERFWGASNPACFSAVAPSDTYGRAKNNR